MKQYDVCMMVIVIIMSNMVGVWGCVRIGVGVKGVCVGGGCEWGPPFLGILSFSGIQIREFKWR